MKRFLPGLLLCLTASLTGAQTVIYSSDSGVLEIPRLEVNGRGVYEDVQLELDMSSGEFTVLQLQQVAASQRQQVTLDFNQEVSVALGVSLSFYGVVSDNRCPLDVTCITGGNAVVNLLLTDTSSPRFTHYFDMELSLNGQDEQDNILSANGYYIRLLEVLPTPLSSAGPEEGDYSITVEISRTPFQSEA